MLRFENEKVNSPTCKPFRRHGEGVSGRAYRGVCAVLLRHLPAEVQHRGVQILVGVRGSGTGGPAEIQRVHGGLCPNKPMNNNNKNIYVTVSIISCNNDI